MTKYQLFASLVSPASAPVSVTINGTTAKVIAIAMEDGSGSSFNITISTGSIVYVRTID